MKFRDKPLGVRSGIIGSIVLPTIYILSLLVTQDPDFIVFALGPLGFVFWIVQWIMFLIGGWIPAIIATILFLTLIGYVSGRLLGWMVNKFRN